MAESEASTADMTQSEGTENRVSGGGDARRAVGAGIVQSQGGNVQLLACEGATISGALGVSLGADGIAQVPVEIIEAG